MSYHCGELVFDAYLSQHTRFAPFNVCMDYAIICDGFPFSQNIAPALLSIFEAIDRNLPDTYKVDLKDMVQQRDGYPENRHNGPTLPLYEVINVGKVIIEILYQFYHVLGDEGYEIRKKLQENENAIFGLSQYARRTKGVPLPTTVEKEPSDLAWAYLKGTPFELLFNSLLPLHFSRKALSEHFFCCARQGHGKTVLLSYFVSQFLQDPYEPSLFILDPAGDWFETVRDRVPPERLIVLDPETNPPPLNFFDFRKTTSAEALQAFRYLMSTLTGGLSDKQNNITPYVLRLLEKVEKPSLTVLRRIMDERVRRATDSKFFYAIEQLQEEDKDFFLNQFYNADMNPTKNAISVKIYGAMGSEAFKKMFTADYNSFDARSAMEGSKVVLARGSENTLGEFGLPIFMQFLDSQIFTAALARFRIPEHKRKQCYLICDEAKHIYNHQSERLLTEARKLKVSFFSATQMLEQIPPEVKAAVYGQTNIKAAGNVSFNDAGMLAREMRGATGEEIQNLNTFEWMIQIANANKAVKVTVKPGALDSLPKRAGSSYATSSPTTTTPDGIAPEDLSPNANVLREDDDHIRPAQE